MEEVAVEADDDLRGLQPIVGVEVSAEGEASARAEVIVAQRLPLVPLRFWEEREETTDLGRERRRCHRAGQEP